MYRKNLQNLEEWKDRSNRKPLVIRGARQVGKTYLVREFAKQFFAYFIEINFDERMDSRRLFQHQDINQVISYIELVMETPVVPGKTLLFLDEIQKAPEVFARLRYFYEKRPDIHIIAAGSLLDLMLADHSFSMPVGRIEYMYMHPMDFHEFLYAVDAGELVAYITRFQPSDRMPEELNAKLKDYLTRYMYIGGMPASVREYANSLSLRQCAMEMSAILNTLRDDFSKYGKKADPDKLRLVLDAAPNLIGRKVKYSNISREMPLTALKQAVKQLELAGILRRIHHSSGNSVPLKAERKERDFKLLFLDSGLLLHALGLDIVQQLQTQPLLANRGALAEQLVGQEWLHQFAWYELPELYYWNRQKPGTSAEVDYLIQINGRVVPVEVKAGTAGSLKSLHVFASEKRVQAAVRFNMDIPAVDDVVSRIPGMEPCTFRLLSLPLYMVSETKRLLEAALAE